MSSVIYKYHFEQLGVALRVKLPRAAKVLHVGVQRNVVCMWVERPVRDEDMVERLFMPIGTGQVIKRRADMSYLGTGIIERPGMMGWVMHIFEVKGW